VGRAELQAKARRKALMLVSALYHKSFHHSHLAIASHLVALSNAISMMSPATACAYVRATN
jgi:hypothetical protein